jgi:hypothetical protein
MRSFPLRGGVRWLSLGGFIAGLSFGSTRAQAESPAVMLTEQLSASPDAPVFGFIWRRAPRASLSTALPIVGAASDATIGLRFTPFVEIHNAANSTLLIPNENWRGRLSLELWRRWQSEGRDENSSWLRAGIAATHESDHSSVRENAPVLVSSFRTLNDLAFRLSASSAAENAWVFSGEVDSRVLFLSCTQPGVNCLKDFDSFSYGGALELTTQRRLTAGWRAFWSLSLSWILPSGKLVEELRLVSHLGLWQRTGGGTWQAFLLAYAGNDVGIFRDSTFRQLGIGIRWAP